MPRKPTTGHIEFDSPATIAELIEALNELQETYGPDATPRVTGFIELHTFGPRVKAISAEPLTIEADRG